MQGQDHSSSSSSSSNSSGGGSGGREGVGGFVLLAASGNQGTSRSKPSSTTSSSTSCSCNSSNTDISRSSTHGNIGKHDTRSGTISTGKLHNYGAALLACMREIAFPPDLCSTVIDCSMTYLMVKLCAKVSASVASTALLGLRRFIKQGHAQAKLSIVCS